MPSNLFFSLWNNILKTIFKIFNFIFGKIFQIIIEEES